MLVWWLLSALGSFLQQGRGYKRWKHYWLKILGVNFYPSKLTNAQSDQSYKVNSATVLGFEVPSFDVALSWKLTSRRRKTCIRNVQSSEIQWLGWKRNYKSYTLESLPQFLYKLSLGFAHKQQDLNSYPHIEFVREEKFILLTSELPRVRPRGFIRIIVSHAWKVFFIKNV